MIDIHAHILPKMDDGSASVEESIEMLTTMRKSGITTVVATPHFDMRRDSTRRFLKRRDKAYRMLMEAVEGLDVPKILLGAEVLYCGVGLNHVEGLEELCLGDGRYLLVETLKKSWDTALLLDMQKLMVEQNVTPVMAHVERYIGSRKNRRILSVLQHEGAMTQGNATLFLVKKTRRAALKMIAKKKIQLVASDCHNMTMRPPNLADAMELIRKKLGDSVAEKLMERAKKVVYGPNLQEE